MFGKVLLLALVCVAATEVVDDELNTIIGEGIEVVNNIHDRTILVLNNALAAYYDNDLDIYNAVRQQIKNLGRHNENEIDAIEFTAQQLTNTAHQSHAKDEVFICISNRRDDVVEELRNAVFNYDRYLTEETEFDRQQLFNVAHYLFKFRSTILFRDSIHQTRDEIKGCATSECVWEVVARYHNENVKIIEDIKKILPRMSFSTDDSLRDVRATLKTAKRETAESKEKGINDMKVCLIKSN